MLSDFHFLRPEWLWLLPLFFLLLWFLHRYRSGAHNFHTVCDAALLPYVLIRTPLRQSMAGGIVALTGLIAIIALAGPTWERLPKPLFKRESALVIALDLSRSMAATDLQPSRLQRARYKIIDLLRARPDGQTGLIVYTTDAFVVTPLTDDVNTILAQLSALSPDLMPAQGSQPLSALQQAVSLLQQAGYQQGDILFVTDYGGDQSLLDKSARIHPDYRVSVLGIGTKTGGPVTLEQGGFLQDKTGAIVMPSTDHESLAKLARTGGGQYVPLSVDNRDIDTLTQFFDRRMTNEAGSELTHFQTNQFRDQGPWLILLLFPLAMLGFRRGYLVWTLVFIIPFTNNVSAFEWRDLWLNNNEQALQQFKSGETARAARQFTQPAWQAAAHYRSGNYQAALDALPNPQTPSEYYNHANALAMQGRLQAALAAYNKTLSLDPKDKDALYNRKLVQEALQKQQATSQRNNTRHPDGSEKNNVQQSKAQPLDKKRQSSQSENSKHGTTPDNVDHDTKQDFSADQDQNKPYPAKKISEDNKKTQELSQPKTQHSQAAPHMTMTDHPKTTDKTPIDQTEENIDTNTSQATTAWLRQIPDDPAGLLRRKFYYQYQKRQPTPANTTDNPW